ncbi:MAG: peptide chain release factor N(5)-glutamine methyltransferase [Clostridia bacterium]|nr:peptide chain release factor N(5)-glutamine methyltransferase [Clostridia bacterium]
MRNLYSVYREAIRSLGEAGCDSPEFDAQQLVSYCFGYNKTQLLMNSGSPVDEAKYIHFADCIKRRCAHEPLQYILGMWDFYKYSFKVGRGVLIPRPETELLVDFAVEKINKNGYKVVFDLCCGSGCIGLSVAKMCPDVRVYCIDLSDDALYYTRQNKELLMCDNVTVFKSDVLESTGFLGLPRPDMILSNPPYIRSAEIPGLQEEVSHEPVMALDGGADGLVFYRNLAEMWYPYINRGGYIALECGEDQAADVLALFLNKADKGRFLKDMQGIDRVVVVKR